MKRGFTDMMIWILISIVGVLIFFGIVLGLFDRFTGH